MSFSAIGGHFLQGILQSFLLCIKLKYISKEVVTWVLILY